MITAIICIAKTPENNAPVVNSKHNHRIEGKNPSKITLTGSDKDGDALTFSIVKPPKHGTVTVKGNIATYRPTGKTVLDTIQRVTKQNASLLDIYANNLRTLDTYDTEIDRFTYKVNDGKVDSSKATVIIAILTKVKLEYTPSKGEINIIGVSETTFNPLTAAIRLRATKVAFSKDKRDMHILHNHNDVPYEKIKLSGNEALLPPILEEGPNVLDIFALDEQGHPIEKEATFWAGSHTIVVTVVDHKTDRAITGAVLTLNLGDGKKLNTKGISQNGKVIFKNIPDRHTVFIHAELKTDNNFYYTSSGGFNVRKEKDKIR